MDAEKQAVIKEIRCLIVTCKNGLYLKRLVKEYKETTGEYIPFRKFGFDSMEAFLRSTNQFILTSCNGDFVLMAKPTEKSAHIAKLVHGQNNTKKKRSDPPRFFRSNYSSGAQQRNYGSASSSQYGNRSTRYQPSKPAYQISSSSAKSVANNNYSYQSSAKPSVPFANTTNTNNQNYSNSYSQPTVPVPASSTNVLNELRHLQQTSNTVSYECQSINPFTDDGQRKVSTTKPTDPTTSQCYQPVQRPQVEETVRESGTSQKSKLMKQAFGITPKRNEQHSFGTEQSDNMHSFVQREQARRLAEENEKRNMAETRQMKPARENIFTTQIPASVRSYKQAMLTAQLSKLCLDTKPKVNIQSRLQLPKKSPDSFDPMPSSHHRIEPEPEPPVFINYCDILNFKQYLNIVLFCFVFQTELFDLTALDACESAVDAITLYCSKKKLSEPSFNFVQLKTKKFICSVEVNNIRYACYPDEYKTKDEAQMATAKTALLEIKELEQCMKYPVCKDSPHDIAQQINACIGINGVFLDSLQTVYQ